MISFFASFVLAAIPLGTEWQDNQALSLGKEPTRAAFSSFTTEEGALKILPETSDRTRSLDSALAWKFKWSKDPDSRPVDFYKPDYDVSAWETIVVPCSWQAMGANGKAGWGTALYTNVPYPFQKDVPGGSRVMLTPPTTFTNYAARNPVGSYRRDFDMPESFVEEGDVFLKFDGVDSFFYLWVNGEYVGFSKDSRSPAEFNVTKYVKPGKNTVALEVYRYSDGSYLEDQDMFRLSGIFRRTWLISRPTERIRDFRLSAKPVKPDQFEGDWELTVDADADGDVETFVAAWDNSPITRSSAKTFVVKNVKPWSAESPTCYKVVLSNGKEFVSTVFGFRVSEMRREPSGVTRYYLNGKKIKLKGGNRHETDPMYGHFVPMWRHEQDVKQLKEANCNCVRNSHYPQDDYWYYLCDVNGLYLVDEANVESHGYGYGEMSLSHQPSWEKATVDRNVSMVKRNFNHPSVVIWSLGNEAGPGENFAAANAAIKALDPVRPIHYERDWSVADMDGCQYPSVPWTYAKAASGVESVKPFYISEYAHNMGNAMGNLKDYQDAIESSDVILGATIWDWVDQGLYLEKNGKRMIAFGGDFGDKPHDGFFCMNGCVLSDRELEPGYWEIKHVYQNWTARLSEDGRKLIIRNKNFFVDATGVTCRWTVLRDGDPFAAGVFSLDGLKPHAENSYSLPRAVSTAVEKGGVIALRVRFYEGDREIASDQIDFPIEEKATLADLRRARIMPPRYSTDEKSVTFQTPEGTVTFAKATGLPLSITKRGKRSDVELLEKPMSLDVYRTPSANESSFAINVGDQWAAWGFIEPVGRLVEISDIETVGGEATFTTVNEWTFPNGKLVRGFNDPEVSITDIRPTRQISFMTAIRWTVGGDGSFRATAKIRSYGPRVELPRVGFSFVMKGGEHKVRWFGRGPWENYADRKSGAFVANWAAPSSTFFVPYCRNECSGDREDAYGFSVGPITFRTLADPFAFAVNPYEPFELLKTVHPVELPESRKTFVGLFAATRGLGGASCGPAPIERDIIRTDRDYDLDFEMSLEFEHPLTPAQAHEVTLPELPERQVATGAKIVTCSSREPGEGDPEHLVDGDLNTIWHTQYGVTMGSFPHVVVVELDKPTDILGYRIYQRQVGVNGRVKDFKIETSVDGVTWSEPATATLQITLDGQEFRYSEPVQAKFYRFTALNNHYGNDFAAIAEIEIIK